MTKLRGFVDRIDKMLIMGWAIDEDDPAARPEIQIIQGHEPAITLVPRFPFPSLRAALDLAPSVAPPLYAWRLWLPLSNGIRPDLPFSIVLRATGVALVHGAGCRIPLFERIDPAAQRNLETAVLITEACAVGANDIHVALNVADPRGPAARPVTAGTAPLAPQGRIGPLLFGRSADRYETVITRKALAAAPDGKLRIGVALDDPELTPRAQLDARVHSVYLPRTALDRNRLSAPLPEDANIHRVSGPASNQHHYLIGGATTFCQLDAITRHYAGKPIRAIGTVVDWGVGCGRVMRQFWEDAPAQAPMPRLIGLDIDPVNVDWCRAHLAKFASFDLLALDGFALPTGSVDLLYGISVMTHLSEHHQHLWLAEIRRILRPGGIAILTVHGEGVNYSQIESILLPFVEKFGFFDGTADTAIGEERSEYYRATYHARGYIRDNWSRYFTILDIFVMANAFTQDFVVLRK